MPRTVPKKDRFFGLFEKLRQPDITGNLTDVAGGASMSFNGRALTGDITDNPAVFGTTGKGRFAGITLQAKRSSNAYGNSATVQPASLRLMPIIRPDITGTAGDVHVGTNASAAGGLEWQKAGNRQHMPLDGIWQFGNFLLSASRSSAVHGKSQTVQMASVRLLAIIRT